MVRFLNHSVSILYEHRLTCGAVYSLSQGDSGSENMAFWALNDSFIQNRKHKRCQRVFQFLKIWHKGIQKMAMKLTQNIFSLSFCLHFKINAIQTGVYQARACAFTNWEDTIPGPSDSIGAPKMYILEKTHFLDPNINVRILMCIGSLKNCQTQFFYVLGFSMW